MPQEEIYCHVFYAMKSLRKKHCMYFSKADDNNIGSICIICCSVSPLTHECMKWKLPLTKAIWSHQNCEETNLCNWEMIFVMLVFYYAAYLNSVLYSCFTVKSILQKLLMIGALGQYPSYTIYTVYLEIPEELVLSLARFVVHWVLKWDRKGIVIDWLFYSFTLSTQSALCKMPHSPIHTSTFTYD